MASQITSLTIVYSTVYSDADQRKHQSSASLAFVRGMQRWLVNSPHKWPVTRTENVSIWWRHHGTLPKQEAWHIYGIIPISINVSVRNIILKSATRWHSCGYLFKYVFSCLVFYWTLSVLTITMIILYLFGNYGYHVEHWIFQDYLDLVWCFCFVISNLGVITHSDNISIQ